jgi:hypothetical protein
MFKAKSSTRWDIIEKETMDDFVYLPRFQFCPIYRFLWWKN